MYLIMLGKYKDMKTKIILLASIVALTPMAFSQKSKPKAVWLKIENKELVPVKSGSVNI
jgi:hypothetical protein